jgi:sugar phosphate permease
VILVVSSGLGFYNASVILAAATDELDASVGAVSGATGLFFAVSGLTGFAFSRKLDSVDIRWFFTLGGIVGALALVGLRFVENVVALYVFFAFFGVGFALAGLVPATTLVTRWFSRRRSVALSIASTGLSVGGIVLTPVSAWLIHDLDLVGAAPWLAALWVLGIIPIAVLVLRSYPSDRGLQPDGAATGPKPPGAASGPGAPSLDGVDFATARTTRFFIALCAAYAAIFFGQVGAIAQLFKMVLERTDNATAASCLSVLALTSVVARLVGGAVVLRVPTKPFTASLAVLQAVALVLLAHAPSATTLILSSAFFGISIGNLLMLQPLLLAEAFGVVNYGRIYSFSQLFGTIGVAGGPLALGVLRDVADYESAFYVAAAASFAGFVFMLAAGPTSRVQALWA